MTAAVTDRLGDAPAAAGPSEARRGAVTMLPLLAGYAPFAVLIGVAVANSSDPWAAWTGVWLVFAGSAHLTVVQLVDAGSGVAVAALSAVVINVRLVVLSATLSPYWRGTPVRSRLRAAATLIDPTWMVSTQRASAGAGGVDPDSLRRFYTGASVLLWFGWAALVTLGAVAGSIVPPAAGLSLLAPMCLLAMVLPRARSLAGAACVLTAGAVAVLGADLPAGCGLLLAMPAGVAAAVLVGRFTSPEKGSAR